MKPTVKDSLTAQKAAGCEAFPAATGSTRFVWRAGMTFEGKRFRELNDREAHCDRCATVGGYTIEADGFYPWHHKRRQETEAGARRVCEQYLARQLKGKAEALLAESELLSSNVERSREAKQTPKMKDNQ